MDNDVQDKGYDNHHSKMLSIIIVTMGDSELLRECLSSIGEHVSCLHEIILVNNCAEPLALPDTGDMLIIENSRNLGFARAVNRGIEAARGDLILLFNPDARFIGDVVTPLADFLHSRPAAGIAGPQLVYPDGSAQNSIDIIPNLATQFLNKSLLKLLFPRAYPSKRSRFTAPVSVPSVIGACMLIRREVIERIGLLDEGFFLYLEETDFCRRATDAGFEVWHLPQLSVVHHQGATARAFDMARRIEFLRSMYRFFLKHRGASQRAALFGLTLLKSVIETAGNLVLCFTKQGRDRLRKSGTILLWHLLGMPASWGLEDLRCGSRKTRAAGYTWFLPEGADLPLQVGDPREFMDRFSDTVVNRSRTTLVKTGNLGGRPIFLKRYNYKGMIDTLKNLFRKSRAQRSFEAALLLRKAGISTPEVLFACEKRLGRILIESYIATEQVQATDLVAHIRGNGCDEGLARRLARLVRRLHEMGIVHVDFKGENVLVASDGFFLIDLDRLRRVPHLSLEMAAKNLSYLHASFARDLPGETRAIFLDEYLKGNTAFERSAAELREKIRAYTDERLARRYNE